MNGCETTRWLLSLIDEKAYQGNGFARLGYLVNRSSDDFRNLRGPIANMAKLNAPDPKKLPMRYWNTLHPRYCSQCLQESPHWRGQWDILFCVICTKHRSVLIDHCQNCHSPLSWNRQSVVRCKCGWDLRKAICVPLQERWLPAAAQLEAYFSNGKSSLRNPIQFVSDLSEEAYLRLIWFVGAYGSFSGNKPQKIMGLQEVSVAIQIFTIAAESLDQWPAGFHQFLDRLSGKYSDNASGNKLRARFGSFYPTLYKSFKEEKFSFLRIAFEEFIHANWAGQLAARHRRLSADSKSRYEWIPLGKAAELIGVRSPTIQAMVKQGLVKGKLYSTPKGRLIGVVHKSEIERLIKEKASQVTLKEARVQLGISRRRAEALMVEGILVPINANKVSGKPWIFDCNHVQHVANHLRNEHSGT